MLVVVVWLRQLWPRQRQRHPSFANTDKAQLVWLAFVFCLLPEFAANTANDFLGCTDTANELYFCFILDFRFCPIIIIITQRRDGMHAGIKNISAASALEQLCESSLHLIARLVSLMKAEIIAATTSKS